MNSVFFLDSQGRLLLGRNYRQAIDLEQQTQLFFRLGGSSDQPPVFRAGSAHFISVRHNSLYVGTTSFLVQLVGLIESYIVKLEEESLRDNYVLIYEILDEAADFGIVQMTDPKVVKEVVTQKGFALASLIKSPQSLPIESILTWRPEGIKHKKNEVYLDVIEKVNLLASSAGQVIKCDLIGEIVAKCYLSGMPELKLGLNDRALGKGGAVSPPNVSGVVELEDVKFHQCVQMAKYEAEKIITFVPPDGEFVLMSYRMSHSDVKPLFWLECIVEKETKSSIEMYIRIRSQFKKGSAANNVEVLVPVPDDVDTPKIKANIGKTKYRPEQGVFVWKIGYFPGAKEFSLNVRFGRPSIRPDDVLGLEEKNSIVENAFRVTRPIMLTFEIPYFTLSGMQVRYLRIDKTSYKALPWVRYITRNGLYQFRMPDKSN